MKRALRGSEIEREKRDFEEGMALIVSIIETIYSIPVEEGVCEFLVVVCNSFPGTKSS